MSAVVLLPCEVTAESGVTKAPCGQGHGLGGVRRQRQRLVPLAR